MMFKKNNAFLFLFIKIPISITLIIIFFEFISFLLSDYRAVRHGLDRKVLSIENNIIQNNPDILLFGDSVTKDIVDDFDIAYNCCNVVNLTTNRASGFLGAYLLYKKYNHNNKNIKNIIISSTPKFLNFFPKGKTKDLYLTNVFNTNDEKKIISTYYDSPQNIKFSYVPLSWVKERYQLTIFNLDNKIIYPLINYLDFINIKTALLPGRKLVPSIKTINNMKVSDLNIDYKKFNNQDSYLPITPEMEKLVEDFFNLLKNKNTNVFIAWAPLKSSYYGSIIKNKELTKLEKYLKTKAKLANINLYIHDFSAKEKFPDNAFRDEDHLKTRYWKTYYAYLLKEFISSVHKKTNSFKK